MIILLNAVTVLCCLFSNIYSKIIIMNILLYFEYTVHAIQTYI